MRKAKNTNPQAKIVLTGCYAQISAKKIKNVDLVLGNTEKLHLIDYINDLQSEKVFVSDIMNQKDFVDIVTTSSSGRTRANIKIQDGCDNRCSYCIIPFARGKSRSRKTFGIIDEINNLVQKGYKEIVLTGIHLGQWGLDFEEHKSLIDLLIEIEKINALKRYRIGSLNPLELSDDLIEFLSSSNKFCNHFHISLQSVNDEILKAMNRKYTVKQIFELCEKIVTKFPQAAIGGDIIVGFPTETEEQFNETFENIKKLPLNYLHVFPYSLREGTKAAGMSPQLVDNVKQQRAKKLKALVSKKKTDFKKQITGSILSVLIEQSRDKQTGFLKGISKNYQQVLVDGEDKLKNTIVKVKIEEILAENLKGIII